MSEPDPPAPVDEQPAAPELDGDLAARARYEREVACLDLTDAEQVADHVPGQGDLAEHLYESADRHRLLAERLEAGDTSALLDAEPPPSSDG